MRKRLLWVTLGLTVSLFGQPKPAPAETRDFDFWIGTWSVLRPDGKVAGLSVIESILNGRVIKESYQSGSGYQGHSFNLYNAPEKRWEQCWVDNSGLALHLTGGLNAAGQMVLAGDRRDETGATVTDRITWTDHGDGTVQQLWESSVDGGQSWTLAFNGRYQPKLASDQGIRLGRTGGISRATITVLPLKLAI